MAASSPSAVVTVCGVQALLPSLVQTSSGASSAAASPVGCAVSTMSRGPSHGTASVRAAASSTTPFVSPPSVTPQSPSQKTSNATSSIVPAARQPALKSDSTGPFVSSESQCSVRQFHASVESSCIVNETDESEPHAGTLPVPVHPVQRCRVPSSSGGAATLAATESPHEWTCVPAVG